MYSRPHLLPPGLEGLQEERLAAARGPRHQQDPAPGGEGGEEEEEEGQKKVVSPVERVYLGVPGGVLHRVVGGWVA